MKRIFLILLVAFAVYACGTSDEGPSGGKNGDNFDRAALLTNAADNIIIPIFEDLSTKLAMVTAAKDDFKATPNQTNLDALRTAWLNAYKTWQYVEMFNIGKAEEINYAFQMNVYPTTVEDVENNVASGSYDLTNVNNNDAVGFPAVDYLLYGIGTSDIAILEKYTNTDGYTNYLSDVVDQMETLTTTVLDDWKNNFRASFVSSTDNTATSALNKMVNDFIFYYEKGLRANKIGIPAGNFSSTPLPEKVEAFYNKGVSKELALDGLQAVEDFFNGKSYISSATGESFKGYLTNLERNDLATLINSKFGDARQKLQALDADFNSQINSDNTKMTEAYDALQSAVVSLKVDMLQAFNIRVDFVDADGD